MNRREKILALVVGGLAAVFIFGYGLRAAILKPLKDKDKLILATKEKLNKINAEKRQFFATEDRMKQLALETFGDTIDQASATLAPPRPPFQRRSPRAPPSPTRTARRPR